MTCKDEAVKAYLASPLILFAPDGAIVDEAIVDGAIVYGVPSQAFLDTVDGIAEYLCHCRGGEQIKRNCPKLFGCWVTHSIAYILVTWGFTFTEPDETNEDGGVSVPAVDDDLIHYVKRDTVGQVTREYHYVEPGSADSSCANCDDKVINQWKNEIERALSVCQKASMVGAYSAVGTSFFCCQAPVCCGADD